MNQADIEKYAFLYFCGEKDRDILLENRKMTFDGVTYNCFTDEELEDLKTVIAYEERKKNKKLFPCLPGSVSLTAGRVFHIMQRRKALIGKE